MGIPHSMYTFATSNPSNPFVLRDRYFCACCFAAPKKQSKKVEYQKKKIDKSGVLQEERVLSAHRVHQNIYMKQSVGNIREKAVKHIVNKRTLPQTAHPQ